MNPIILGFLYNMLYLKFEAVPILTLLREPGEGKLCEFPFIRMFFITSTSRWMKFGSN